MGSVGAKSKPIDPIQEPSKFNLQPTPTLINMAAEEDQSKSTKEQLPNPGTMDEINKRTKGKHTH